jgi:elongation factor Ts
MKIRSEEVKRLRDETGIGIMDCKSALTKAEGDLGRAKQILREEGLELIGKSGRPVNEGRIEAYIHHSGKVGVLLEVNSNTDFAANSDDFREFARDVAMQIAANKPRHIAPEDVPEAELEAERDILRKQGEKEGKPPKIIEKIVEGRLKKFYAEVCLLKQPFIKDPSRSIEEILADLRTKTGEDIGIKRFARFEIGEDA